MKLLFQYSDYVSLLTHENEVVRLWAFEAIENRHRRKFTPEVAGILGDANQHLACAAPRYLADHRAMDYAPAILDSFHSGQGPAPGNCAMALGVLGYLPAKDAMLQRLSQCESPDTFLGICSYLGLVKDDDCRYALLDILEQVSDEYFVGAVAGHLLRHGQPDDVSFVLSFCPKQTSLPRFLADILEPLGCKDIYSHLTQPSGRTFMEEPGESLNRVLRWHSGIEVDTSLRAELPGLIKTGRYKELAAVLTLESEKEIKARYEPFDLFPDELTALKEKDALALRFITEVGRSYFWSKQGPNWQDKHGALFAAMVAAHLAILRRRCVVPAIAPNATHEQMILCLAAAEKDLPESVVERLISRAEVKGFAAALSDGLTSIGDQDIAELLGRCPQQTAVDELLRIVRDTDGLAILHDTAAQALRQMEPSGQEMILERLIQGRLEDALDIMSQLEHLPYAESFDLALKQWDRGGADYIESYAHCLAGIGDPRGIAELQKLWSVYESLSVGRPLETLAALHDRQIPELPEIKRMEQESKRFQAERRQEFAAMATNIDRLGGDPFGIPEPVETVRRDGPKLGRNAPCPCGSGKKYKKCCLRKS